jgi:hypothetical protein
MMVITSALDTFAVAMGTLALRLTYGLEFKPTFKYPDQTSVESNPAVRDDCQRVHVRDLA